MLITSGHVSHFEKTKKLKDETVLEVAEGYIGKMMGKGDEKQHNGHFILTNQRVCFMRKSLFGEVFQHIPLAAITSIETKSLLGYRALRIHTSHDDLEFKTFLPASEFDSIHSKIQNLRSQSNRTTAVSVAAEKADLVEKLNQLSSLMKDGLLTEPEYAQAKQRLLAS